ncbi:MAG: hypothetical protein GEV03_21665 [Streptosporangiales bacterium]|nr:hypothetical protein [Streptosporangiales bacterium]
MSTIACYRDDGLLALAVGTITSRNPLGRLSPLPFALLGAAAPFVAISGRADLSAAGALWCALVAAVGSHSGHTGRLDWLVPAILRATEYVFLVAVGLAGGVPGPLIFGLICAVAYHHYDTVYRLRQGIDQPPWVSRAGLGWEGRMLIAGLAALVGMQTPGFAAMTAVLGTLFVVESVVSWMRAQRGGAPEDIEGERPEE